jgi:hypothetical protein
MQPPEGGGWLRCHLSTGGLRRHQCASGDVITVLMLSSALCDRFGEQIAAACDV